MSDSDESGVTYTEVSSLFENLSDIRSPRADYHEHLELPGMLEDPYVEDDDEDPEEDTVDYLADGGDDGDDEEGSSEDDDMDIEAGEEEKEEEHPAPADSVVVALPTTDQAPSAKETEPFKNDESAATPPPHPAYRMTARISIPAPVPVPAWSDSEVARLLAMSTPPSSPLSPLSSPPPRIPFPPLPPILSPPTPVASTSYSPPLPPPFILSPTRSDEPSSGISPPLPISAPTSSPSLQLLSLNRMEDRHKVTLPPRKRLCIALGPRYEVRESSSAPAARPAGGLKEDYGFVTTMDREIRHDSERECIRTRLSYFPTNVTIPRRQRKQISNIVEPEIRTIVEMADNRTMAQMLQAPIEGYEDAIVVPPINANNFELKQHPEVPNTTIKLLLFPFSLEGEARTWLDKKPPHSILTWEDLVLKFINQFFPPSKKTYLRNEIINFLKKPNETFNEAWERFKNLLRQCPHHGFSKLHQLDTFYNALNPNDQDALDSAAGGNFLDKIPRDGLSIIESKSKVRYSRSCVTDSRVSTNALLLSSSPSNSFDLQ
uniref:Reverse transcriptase domain-containing protein n=1 Tax=Tanacetum cinerariifolium TaxID=118510 RepID=A0A6L2NBJ0_TANCI|nr:reverse transcriptase domain-containing protein [Tanacetum cinerariifolium]